MGRSRHGIIGPDDPTICYEDNIYALFHRALQEHVDGLQPHKLNRYVYCYNNPVNDIDPLGLMVLEGAAGGLALDALILLAAYGAYEFSDELGDALMGAHYAIQDAIRDVLSGGETEPYDKTQSDWDKQADSGREKVAWSGSEAGVFAEGDETPAGDEWAQDEFGKGEEGAQAGVNESTEQSESSKKPSSSGKMQKEVESGKAPKSIDRVDRGHVPGQENHVHYKDGTSSARSGKIHDAHKGRPKPSRKTTKWLGKHGWSLPE